MVSTVMNLYLYTHKVHDIDDCHYNAAKPDNISDE